MFLSQLRDANARDAHGSCRGYCGTAADVWSLGATLIEALVGVQSFEREWMPAYDDFRNTDGPQLLSRVRLARAAVHELATAMFAEDARPPRTWATGAATDPAILETLANLPLRTPEILIEDGEAVVDPAEAARRSELARGLATVALACVSIELDTRPTVLEIFGRVRELEDVAGNAR